MKRIGLASYERRVSRAARTLLDHQGFDGGWGLTLSSVSSIVNTSEVLLVLRAAGIGGKPARDALSYLAESIEEHCRPRQKGGRGENTRFVCFGLMGLLRYPEFFTQPGVAETAAWSVDWLERHQVGQGWPEVAGIDDAISEDSAGPPSNWSPPPKPGRAAATPWRSRSTAGSPRAAPPRRDSLTAFGFDRIVGDREPGQGPDLLEGRQVVELGQGEPTRFLDLFQLRFEFLADAARQAADIVELHDHRIANPSRSSST